MDEVEKATATNHRPVHGWNWARKRAEVVLTTVNLPIRDVPGETPSGHGLRVFGQKMRTLDDARGAKLAVRRPRLALAIPGLLPPTSFYKAERVLHGFANDRYPDPSRDINSWLDFDRASRAMSKDLLLRAEVTTVSGHANR